MMKLPNFVATVHFQNSSVKGVVLRDEAKSGHYALTGDPMDLGKEKVLRLFQNDLLKGVLPEGMGGSSKKLDCCKGHRTMIWVAQIDIWILIALTCLTKKE